MQLSPHFKKYCKKISEIVLVVGVIIFIWCVMSLPSVFFFMDLQQNLSSTTDLPTLDLNVLLNTQRQCSDRFYLDGLLCKPECGTWKSLPDNTQLTLDVFGLFLISINLFVALIIFIVVFLQRKKMLKFPQVIVLYLTITAVIEQLFVLVAYAGGSAVFCSDRDYTKVLVNPTGFCTAAGAAILFVFTQLMVWWVAQVSILFWKLLFPFHARFWEQRGRFKYIHIGTVLLAILFPAILITISLTVGTSYYAVDYLPQLCGPSDREVSFYILVLPGCFMLAVGVTLLWIVAWKIFKERSQKRNDSKQMDRVVEIKLSIVLLYYMLISALFFIAFGVFFTVDLKYSTDLTTYLLCEAIGIFPGKDDCDRSTIDSYSFPLLICIAVYMFSAVPSVSLVYVVSWRDVKNVYKKLCKRVKMTTSFKSELTV